MNELAKILELIESDKLTQIGAERILNSFTRFETKTPTSVSPKDPDSK